MKPDKITIYGSRLSGRIGPLDPAVFDVLVYFIAARNDP
jgi:hypothetical protein